MTEKDLVEKAVANALFPYLIGVDLEEEAARAALQAIEERGFVLVPREPTEEMRDAFWRAMFDAPPGEEAPVLIGAGYDAMIAAAHKDT